MMTTEERISALEEGNRILEEKVNFLEFRLELISDGSNVCKLLLDYKITKNQYEKIMDLMDAYSKKLDKKESVSHMQFENEISKITGINDYHFSEAIAKAFFEDGRWDEIFPALYGDMAKYKYYMDNWRKNQ